MSNININVQASQMELTEAIRDYIESRVTNLGKLLEKFDNIVQVNFDVGKDSNSSNSGDLFKANASIRIDGDHFVATVTSEDLYAAIDEVKEKLFREINQKKSRKRTLFHRGARSLKKRLKGIREWSGKKGK